jgi:hypothetical protein
MIILSKVVSFLPINSGLFLFTVSAAFIVQYSPVKEDDTMISVSGIFIFFAGYKVNNGMFYRCSEEDTFVVDLFDLSLKRRLVSALRSGSILHRIFRYNDQDDPYDSPNKARIVEKPSIASTSSYQFGGDRMIKAQRGVLERQSLEGNCLSADGELSSCEFFFLPVFDNDTLLPSEFNPSWRQVSKLQH